VCVIGAHLPSAYPADPVRPVGAGDPASRLDRWETELDTAIPGGERDTTTPAALGDALGAPERDQLVAWLKANTAANASARGRPRTGSPATRRAPALPTTSRSSGRRVAGRRS
jgi:hypothetical protein